MDSNYVIGVGGSGSKCVESLLHVCASGLGPDRMGLALVDQDLSNGNLTRTKQLLSLYRGLHAKLHNGSHGLRERTLLHTAFTTADTAEWSPLREKRATLDTHFNYKAMRDEAKMLFECLFERRYEREQSLDEGFRGRAALGAAAMFSAAASRSHFWDRLFSDMGDIAEGEEMRVFLFASIFGGTGASGFPTIAKIIKEMAEEHAVKVRIGGALLLPYFEYPDPPASVERQSVILSREFKRRSRQALEYYHDLLTYQDPELFDQIYLLGFDPLLEIGYFKEGGTLQRNKPLLPELLGALAALNFFRLDRNSAPQVLRAGRSSRNVSWEEIPRLDPRAKGHDVKQHLGRLIRFAIAFLVAYYPYLQPNSYPAFRDQHWFRRLIADADVDVGSDDVQQLISELAKYCQELLTWAASLKPLPDSLTPEICLFDFERIVQRNPVSGVTLRLNELTSRQKQSFQQAIPPGAHHGLDGVFEGLSRARSDSAARGLGVFLQTLFDECHL
ncbi:MAG: tubulin-like doman-containing protein [Gammaproteobacteria bacterium]